jgi:hypothetical protein
VPRLFTGLRPGQLADARTAFARAVTSSFGVSESSARERPSTSLAVLSQMRSAAEFHAKTFSFRSHATMAEGMPPSISASCSPCICADSLRAAPRSFLSLSSDRTSSSFSLFRF